MNIFFLFESTKGIALLNAKIGVEKRTLIVEIYCFNQKSTLNPGCNDCSDSSLSLA